MIVSTAPRGEKPPRPRALAYWYPRWADGAIRLSSGSPMACPSICDRTHDGCAPYVLAPIASRDAPIAHRNRTGGGSGRLSRDSPSVLLAPVAGLKVAA